MAIESNPAAGAYAITPADSDFTPPQALRGLYIGGTGNLKVDMSDGTTVTFSSVPAGTVLPVRVKRVWSTGTTATLIIGLY